MDISLTDAQREFQERVRRFAATEIQPVAADLDRQGICPQELIDKIGDIGLLGAFVPAELGGAGADYLSYILGLEEISRAWASLSAIISVHNSLVCYPILKFGSDEQKRKYLPLLTRGKQLGCYAFAEPSAGSDANAIQTTAQADGDSFVLNGRKAFVTNGRRARIGLVYALTDPSRGRRGLSVFVVQKDLPGQSVGKLEEMLGLRAVEMTKLRFESCRVPKANLLGGLNRGFEIAVSTTETARIDIAAQAVGIAQACLDECVAHTKQRRQFGRPIAEFEAIQWMLADLSTEIEAARLLTHRAATIFEQGGNVTRAGAMAKLFASEVANKAAYHAVQIFGGHGYLKDFPVERLFRDARSTTLYEETSEILRLVIGRELARTATG
jgi:butyryl-CoA dehydrogenase